MQSNLSLGRKDAFLEDLQSAYALYEQLKLGEVAARVAAEIAYILVWDAQPARVFNLVSRALELLGLSDTFGNFRLPAYIMNVAYPLIDEEIVEFCRGKKAVFSRGHRPATGGRCAASSRE